MKGEFHEEITGKLQVIILLSLLAISVSSFACNKAYVKYRDLPVCLERFTYQDTSKSSFVRGAWYDVSKSYMLLGLSGTK